MSMSVEAIFEKGVLKPLGEIDLKEHQRVEIFVRPKDSAVERTRGMFRAKPALIKLLRKTTPSYGTNNLHNADLQACYYKINTVFSPTTP